MPVCGKQSMLSWQSPGEAVMSTEGRQASGQTSRATPVACSAQASILSV